MPEAWKSTRSGKQGEDPVAGEKPENQSGCGSAASMLSKAALKVMEEKQAARVSILLMNPQNGEIYACVNVPGI